MKKATPPQSSSFNTFTENTTTIAQRERLLQFLIENGSVNTMFARDRLNILAPAAGIKGLREQDPYSSDSCKRPELQAAQQSGALRIAGISKGDPISLRKAINKKYCESIGCESGHGSRRQQTGACAAFSCPLYPGRPIPSKPLGEGLTAPQISEMGQYGVVLSTCGGAHAEP
jgi:hypothetical protein